MSRHPCRSRLSRSFTGSRPQLMNKFHPFLPSSAPCHQLKLGRDRPAQQRILTSPFIWRIYFLFPSFEHEGAAGTVTPRLRIPSTPGTLTSFVLREMMHFRLFLCSAFPPARFVFDLKSSQTLSQETWIRGSHPIQFSFSGLYWFFRGRPSYWSRRF